jgi:kynureninase
MTLKSHFSRFLESTPDRLHFAAHSHHPWPNVTYEAHKKAWNDAAEMMDDKWEYIFGTLVPHTKNQIAREIGLSDGESLTFAPNTHEFLMRIFSTLEPPVRILSTDSEFHSFTRQSRRWEEEGLAIVDRVSAEPFASFHDRFTREARSGNHDLILLSQVFYNSGFVVPDIDRIVSSVSETKTLVVIDGYHGFMAMPTNIGAIQDRAFFLAGGYKYAMAGEGVCFLHSPASYGPRPVNTGWYAGFGQLETGVSERIPYAVDGTRFSGATFDPSGVYRMNAVFDWLGELGMSSADISSHVRRLQNLFLETAKPLGDLLPDSDHSRGSFLTFRTARASDLYEALHARSVVTDYRGDRLRIGFGIYHDDEDVDRLVSTIDEIYRQGMEQ